MAILVDTPRWPAHGRLWAHLVSDSDLAELHAFARAHDIPARAFDLDHYDVPEEAIDRLVAGGARPVDGHVLVRALIASGLRVRKRDRVSSPGRASRPPASP
jgi:hypothetical protein